MFNHVVYVIGVKTTTRWVIGIDYTENPDKNYEIKMRYGLSNELSILTTRQNANEFDESVTRHGCQI